jgi:hypothetical protein
MYDFASILRYVEDRFALPRLSEYDRQAQSIAPDLELTQRPRAPLVLSERTCPPGAYATTTALAGRVVGVVDRADEHAILIHTGSSPDPATLMLGSQSVLQDATGRTITLQEIAYGDSIRATGVPSPDKALVYLSHHVSDIDSRFGLALRSLTGLP